MGGRFNFDQSNDDGMVTSVYLQCVSDNYYDNTTYGIRIREECQDPDLMGRIYKPYEGVISDPTQGSGVSPKSQA